MSTSDPPTDDPPKDAAAESAARLGPPCPPWRNIGPPGTMALFTLEAFPRRRKDWTYINDPPRGSFMIEHLLPRKRKPTGIDILGYVADLHGDNPPLLLVRTFDRFGFISISANPKTVLRRLGRTARVRWLRWEIGFKGLYWNRLQTGAGDNRFIERGGAAAVWRLDRAKRWRLPEKHRMLARRARTTAQSVLDKG